jgi:hypothetical protein
MWRAGQFLFNLVASATITGVVMSRPAMLTAAVAMFALASTVTFASLYRWNAAKRPPIALADALSRAEKLLGDDAANRYCVSVSLFGDETGEGKEGAWNLVFAAADGSKKNVYINMQGKSDVQIWNGPLDKMKNEGRRTDLADVRKRLDELFTKEGIHAKYESLQDSLTVKYEVRDFQIYPEQEDGSYSSKLETVPGPNGDGIWLQVQIVDKPDLRVYRYDDGPYWRWLRGTYFTTKSGKFLSIDLRYGPNVKYEVMRQMEQIFGDETPRG